MLTYSGSNVVHEGAPSICVAWYSARMQPLVVYWSRRDFRLIDNPALSGAIAESRERGVPLLPLFIVEDYMLRAAPESQFGLPSRLFLGRAIPEFAARFDSFLLAYGVAPRILLQLAQDYEIAIHVNEDVYPDFYAQVGRLRESGVPVKVYADQLTIPKETATGSGSRYSVFTPFMRAVLPAFAAAHPLPAASPASAVPLPRAAYAALVREFSRDDGDPRALSRFFADERRFIAGGHIIDISPLAPRPSLEGWYVSEAEALAHFEAFLARGALEAYGTARDELALEDGTSRMSLALTWGLVSARQLAARVGEYYDMDLAQAATGPSRQSAARFVSELIWREFYKYLLYHDPSLMQQEFQPRFRGTVRWVEEPGAQRRFEAWIRGETGYRLVDAAMRQLAQTGYMHNRARMVVASVLTKNLGVDWRWGQEYFRAALVDLDEASNNGGWQWGASVGADPKPIRIFNPLLQAKRFDPEDMYQRRWLPVDYDADTHPLVPHATARAEALARYGLAVGAQ